ncbi:cytochrome c551 [Cytobacillus eiseniae]|uniref:Cytochrome c551 n=1 Tax=Cytobacillus eiseniae TaxID=762947 RepID=A0ABS4RGK4_9BACI|nr:cytochrome c551 [Cytobacillus eiseniae]
MKKKLLALLLGSSLVLAACGGGDDAKEETTDKGSTGGETTTANAGDAEKFYNQKCSSCHGGDLTGGVGPALDTAGANFSKEDIEGIIANGQGAMPAGLLSGDEASQVAEWLAAKK